MRNSFNQRWLRIELRLPTKKSVVTRSLPFCDCATETTGCVCTPFGEFQRCELTLRLSVLALFSVTSTFPRPTLLLPLRGFRTLCDWKNEVAEAQFAAAAVQPPL